MGCKMCGVDAASHSSELHRQLGSHQRVWRRTIRDNGRTNSAGCVPDCDSTFQRSVHNHRFECGIYDFDFVYINTWTAGEFLLMIVHHTLCILMWPISSFTGWAQGWVIWFIAMEISNVFLTARWMFLEAGLKDSIGKKLNDCLFLVCFFVSRILPIPVYLVAWYFVHEITDVSHMISKGVSSETAKILVSASYLLAYTCLAPIFLNLFWFYKILGMISKTFKPKEEKQ